MEEITITKPVLDEARRLLDFYSSHESDIDEHTAQRLTSFTIRPATMDEAEKAGAGALPSPNHPDWEPSFLIAAETAEVHGPIGEILGTHESYVIISESGKLITSVADGVES